MCKYACIHRQITSDIHSTIYCFCYCFQFCCDQVLLYKSDRTQTSRHQSASPVRGLKCMPPYSAQATLNFYWPSWSVTTLGVFYCSELPSTAITRTHAKEVEERRMVSCMQACACSQSNGSNSLRRGCPGPAWPAPTAPPTHRLIDAGTEEAWEQNL